MPVIIQSMLCLLLHEMYVQHDSEYCFCHLHFSVILHAVAHCAVIYSINIVIAVILPSTAEIAHLMFWTLISRLPFAFYCHVDYMQRLVFYEVCQSLFFQENQCKPIVFRSIDLSFTILAESSMLQSRV